MFVLSFSLSHPQVYLSHTNDEMSVNLTLLHLIGHIVFSKQHNKYIELHMSWYVFWFGRVLLHLWPHSSALLKCAFLAIIKDIIIHPGFTM